MQRFSPLQCISNHSHLCGKIAVIILNKKFPDDSTDTIFKKLWHDATYRACADGGANYLYDMQQHSNSGGLLQMPNLICGDFDSIRPEVKNYFSNHSLVEVVPTPDQNMTDFSKCVKLLGEKIKSKLLDIDLIVALSGRQDRCDHAMGNISTLYRAPKLLPNTTRLCLMYDYSYVTLLLKGKTILDVVTGHEGDWCGLIPVGHPAIVDATGLKWNLQSFKLEFGEMISTSNELDGSGVVSVETDFPLVWTMSFKI